MLRKNFYLTEEQVSFMEDIEREQGLTVSEQIRIAINNYIEKTKKIRLNNISSSSSKLIHERPKYC